MKSYLITIDEKNLLLGQNMPNGSYYNPVQDINGEWFIFQQEFECCGLGVLSAFTPIPNEII